MHGTGLALQIHPPTCVLVTVMVKEQRIRERKRERERGIPHKLAH